MKRPAFLLCELADTEIRLARAFFWAWKAANCIQPSPNASLLKLYRSWMREHALRAVRFARAYKTP